VVTLAYVKADLKAEIVKLVCLISFFYLKFDFKDLTSDPYGFRNEIHCKIYLGILFFLGPGIHNNTRKMYLKVSRMNLPNKQKIRYGQDLTCFIRNLTVLHKNIGKDYMFKSS